MTLEQLRIFLAVADALHFTRAAEAVGLTQPAVSAAIAALESASGVRLFDRIGRRVELTIAGTLFRVEAAAILRRVGDAEALLAELSGLRRGALSLIASQTVGSYWLPPRLCRFWEAYPGIRVDLRIGNTAEVAQAVRDGAAELGIAEGVIDDPALVSEEIPGDRLVLVVGPRHPWFGRGAIAPGELAATPWVVREPGSGTRALFDDALRRAGLSHDAVTMALTLPNGEAIRGAVLAGSGAAIISALAVAEELRGGAMHALDGLDLPARPFRLVRHRDRYRSAAERAFVRLAVEDGAPATPR